MNIFAVDNNPEIAAQNLCDKHVVKMIVENSMLLSTAVRRVYPTIDNSTGYFSNVFYKSSWVNHPCNKWLIEDAILFSEEQIKSSFETLGNFNFGIGILGQNYWWLCLHAKELAREYTRRYNRRHKCEDIIDRAIDFMGLCGGGDPINADNTKHLWEKHTEFKQCMPIQYKIPGDPVQAYRAYYIGEKSRFAKWKFGNVPEWFTPNELHRSKTV